MCWCVEVKQTVSLRIDYLHHGLLSERFANQQFALRMFGSRRLDSEEAQRRFEPAKELQLVQERVEPTISDAIVDIERLGVMPLMMLRL